MCACVCVCTFRAYNTMSHCSLYLNSLFDTERNNLFMEDRTIEIKLYWLKWRMKSYLKQMEWGFKNMQPTFLNVWVHVWSDDKLITSNHRHISHCWPPKRFYLLSRAPFYQMEKYTFISLYYLHYFTCSPNILSEPVFPHFGK